MATTESRRSAFFAQIQAALIMLAAVWAHGAMLRARPGDPGAAVAAATAMAFGGLAIAATLQRHVPVPRWTHFAGAGIFALALIAAAVMAPAGEAARHLLVWWFPWYLMTTAVFSPGPARGICANPAVAGRIYFGVSSLLAAAYVLAARFGVHF